MQFAESGRVPTVRVESESACIESESRCEGLESESSKIGTRVPISGYNGESMSRTRVVVIATFFVYFTFQTCEIVMEKGIESHGKVMEKSWNFTEA